MDAVEPWSGEHVAALGVTAAGTALLIAAARCRGTTHAPGARRALAVLLASGFLAEQLTYAVRGEWTPRVNLPLQLTDAVTIVSVAALWRPGCALLVELAYFWALSASLQALLTPDLGATFPDPLFLAFFATHSGAVAAACLLVFGERRALRPGAVRRAFAATVAFAALAALGNALTGGNYMYLRRKPARGSLLDLLGPWPVYLLGAAAVGLLLFVALARLAALVAGRSGRS
jgi:hypothetical integral membrane protein (TIGR02206 family)